MRILSMMIVAAVLTTAAYFGASLTSGRVPDPAASGPRHGLPMIGGPVPGHAGASR